MPWVWKESQVDPPSTVQVDVADNPEVGRLLGPDGQLIKIIRAKPDHPIGFHGAGTSEFGKPGYPC